MKIVSKMLTWMDLVPVRLPHQPHLLVRSCKLPIMMTIAMMDLLKPFLVRLSMILPLACMADNDGDGYGYMIAPSGGVGGNDCDDTDPSVYFGAPEIPGDGISQDCDNSEDCYVDNDGDGFGSTSVVASLDLDCTDAGESDNSADCDDSTSDISPDASEVPYDGDRSGL